MEDLLTVIYVLVIIILIQFFIDWKDKLQIFRPYWFYEIRINMKTGNIKDILYLFWWKDEPKQIKVGRYEYNTAKTYKTKNGSKAFEYLEGEPNPVDFDKMEFDRNMELELRRKEIRYADMFLDEGNLFTNIYEKLLPFLFGVAVGYIAFSLSSGALNGLS